MWINEYHCPIIHHCFVAYSVTGVNEPAKRNTKVSLIEFDKPILIMVCRILDLYYRHAAVFNNP